MTSQVPQPLLLVDGWVYNTLKTWEFFFRPFQRFFFVTRHEERIRIGQVDVSARDWPCAHSVSFTKYRVTAILRAPQDCHLHLRIATSASAVSNWRCSQMQNGEIWQILLKNWTNPMLLESRNEVAILRCSHVFRVLYTQLTFKSVGEPD